MVNVGRHHSLPRPHFGFIAPGQMRGCTFNAPGQHLWVYRLGVWGGRYTVEDTDNVTTRVAVYAVDGSMNPAARRGYSASMTVTSTMNDQTGGTSNEADVAVADDGPGDAIPLWATSRFHLAVLGVTGSLGHGMQSAANITADNERFYNRTGLSQPPPDPFGIYTASTEGHMAIWAVADVNVAPDVPTGLSPTGSISELAPDFEATFSDDNENRGDRLGQYRIQVRRKSDGQTFWNTTITASSGEQAAGAIEKAYGGTTLVRGTAYEWRCQMADYFGAWSNWTAWTEFTPASTGTITLDGDPTGKIETVTPDFDGKWTHADSEDMTEVQIGLYDTTGNTLLQLAAVDVTDVESSASPGTAFTVDWDDTGFTALAWGTGYQYRMRGKDESGVWSNFTAMRSFRTNAAPLIPTDLRPNQSVIPQTSYPLLTCVCSDPDDTVATGLKVYARIYDADGEVVVLGTEMAFNESTGRWEYQTDGDDIAEEAEYSWSAYSYDGTLYSGEKTNVLLASNSDSASFAYAEGATVTVTSPEADGTLTSSDLTVTWTDDSASGQISYSVTVYDADGDEVISTGALSGDQTVTISDDPNIRNGQTYTVIVGLAFADLTTASSQPVTFDVSYTPPDPVANLQAEVVKVGTDVWPSAVRLTWDETVTANWRDYKIQRIAETGPDAGTILLAGLTSQSQTTYTDYVPASGHAITYRVTQTAYEGVDTIVSDPVDVTVTLELGGVVLVSVDQPEALRTSLRYTNERDYPRRIIETVYEPLNGDKPTTVRQRGRTVEPTFDARLFDDVAASAATRRDELEAIDQDGGTYCYRDNHGRKLFVTIPEITPTDMVPNWYIVRIGMREERYREGVVAILTDLIGDLL